MDPDAVAARMGSARAARAAAFTLALGLAAGPGAARAAPVLERGAADRGGARVARAVDRPRGGNDDGAAGRSVDRPRRGDGDGAAGDQGRASGAGARPSTRRAPPRAAGVAGTRSPDQRGGDRRSRRGGRERGGHGARGPAAARGARPGAVSGDGARRPSSSAVAQVGDSRPGDPERGPAAIVGTARPPAPAPAAPSAPPTTSNPAGGLAGLPLPSPASPIAPLTTSNPATGLAGLPVPSSSAPAASRSAPRERSAAQGAASSAAAPPLGLALALLAAPPAGAPTVASAAPPAVPPLALVVPAVPIAARAGGRARSGAPARSRRTRARPRRVGAGSFLSPPVGEVTRIVREIPTAMWIALAALAGLALVAGAAAALLGARARRTGAAAAMLRRRAITDSLTGALNRRGFEERLHAELARARRTGRPLAVVFLDIAGLKLVNDTAGHHAGDRLLQAVAGLLGGNSREEDAIGRIGGDEWAVVLPEQDAGGAEAWAARLEGELEPLRAELDLAAPWALDLGTASYPEDGSETKDLLAAADRRLYARRGIDVGR
jgi:diguanylate cyclase (GGDEF)-like protein